MSAAREELLIRSWMSHDARWFNAVAGAFGLEAANRVNQEAAREAGKSEAKRAGRHIGVDRVDGSAQCVRTLDALCGLFGAPADLLDYDTTVEDDSTFSIRVKRCFAHENVTRAGIAGRYDCGIFARIEGWLEGLGCRHEISPPLRGCLKAQGRECIHRVRIHPRGGT